MSPDMMASYAADVTIRARAWMLDAVIDVKLHPRLVNNTSNKSKFHMNMLAIYSTDAMHSLIRIWKG